MKNISFKAKTTVWITALVSAVCILCVIGIVLMGIKLSDNQIEQSLISTVESNADEIEYKNGILEIESDFEFYKDGIYCDIYSSDFEYIGGETPNSLIHFSDFENGKIKKTEKNDNSYLVYDYRLDFSRFEYEIDVFSGQIIKYEANALASQNTSPAEYSVTYFENGINTEKAIDIALSHAGTTRENTTVIAAELPGYESRQVFRIEFICSEPVYDSIWIRGLIPSASAENAFGNVGKAFILIIPLFIILAAVGAYIISKKTIKPIEDIGRSAHEISSGKDLSKRIEINSDTNEITTLAKTFNEMLKRLQISFESEKQFTSDASHELRTPLAVIKAECEYALSGNADDNDKSVALESVLEQSDKMNSLVNSLLYLARTEQGMQRFKLIKTDLSSLICEICNNFNSEKGIKLESKIENGIFINAEPSLIYQMVENLLSNAVNYGKENGYIKVSLYNENSNIILSVKDNGIGIKEEDLSKIWNRFYRTDTSRSGGEGFGLGLALVKQIVQLHGGEVKVDSVIGEGSEFFIIFSKKV